MKGLQKKILIVLFVCIALFAFSAVGFAKTTDENGLDVQNFEYSLSAENKIHLQTVDGKNYLFLPASESDFDIRKLECGDLKPVWDGLKEEEKGKEKLKIDLIEPGAGSEGEIQSFTLYVMQSENLSTMYLTSKNASEQSREWVDTSKDNVAKGSMLFETAKGKSVYDGALTQIKARGNSTFKYYPKKSYQIKLDKKTSLIKGTEKGKTWILLAAYTDPTKMADQIWKEVAAATGDTYAAKEETIDLYYDGEYRGTYMLSEKNQINKNRIDITDMEEAYTNENPAGYGDSENMVKKKATNKYKQPYYYSKQIINGTQQNVVEPDKKGGFLLEMNGTSGDEMSWFKTNNGIAYNVKSPEFTGQESMKYVSEYMEEFTRAIQAQNKKGEHTGVNPTTGKHYYEYCDLDSLARMYLLNTVSGNSDGMWRSFYFYKDVDGIMYAGPVWDMELTLGTGWVDDIASEQDLMAGTALGRELIQIPSFQKKVKELYEKEFVPVEQSLLGQGGSLTSIQDRADYVHASVKMDNILWIHNLRSGSPYAGYPNKSYQEYVEDNKQGKYIYWDSKVSYQDIVNWRLDWLSKHKQYLDATYAALNPGEDGIQELTPEVPDDDKTKPDDNKKDDNKKPNTTTAVKPEIIRSIPQTINAIVKATAGNVQISWNKVAGAKGYDVWITKCGSSYKKGVQKTTRKLNTKVSLKKFKKFNLRTGSWKVKVRAYTYVNGKKKVLVTGSNLHFALITSGQYTNAKKISVNKKKVNLKKGGKFKVKAEIIKERKGRKLLPQTHCKSLQWKTTNAKIATVKNGKITAKQKGVCKIYVIAANGVKKRIKVTVN